VHPKQGKNIGKQKSTSNRAEVLFHVLFLEEVSYGDGGRGASILLLKLLL
jgi:hypothetical protein